MAKDKKSFIAYSDWDAMFQELPDEVAGKLIKHIFAYVNDRNPEADDYIIKALFANIKATLKRDLQKWEQQRQQRVEAGKRSAEARSTKINERSTVVKSRQRKSTVNVNGNVNVNVNDNVNVNEEEKNTFAQKNNFLHEKDLLNKVYSYFDLKVIESLNEKSKNKWLDEIRKLHEIDNYSFAEIQETIIWGRQDEFWSNNFHSILGLRTKGKDGTTKFYKINKKMKADENKNYNSKRAKLAREIAADMAADPFFSQKR